MISKVKVIKSQSSKKSKSSKLANSLVVKATAPTKKKKSATATAPIKKKGATATAPIKKKKKVKK